MLCILYVTAIGLLLGVIGTMVERLLPVTVARRWLWCVVIAASIALPGYYRFHHSFALDGASDASTIAGLDADFLSRLDQIGIPISRAATIVSAFLILWALLYVGWVSHMLRVSRGERRGPRQAAVDGIPVVISDSLGPATVGVWRSRVVLPRWVLALPDLHRRYIVRHEEEHRRSHDCALLFLASLSVVLMPWNLALWWQLRRLSLAVEMDCDTRVVSALGDPHAYGSLLLAVAQSSNPRSRLQPALLGGTGMLEHRLTALLAPARLRLVQRLLLPVIACALLLIVLATPHPVIAGHAHATMTSSSTTPR